MKIYIIIYLITILPSCAWVGSYIRQINLNNEKEKLVELSPIIKKCHLSPEKLTLFTSDMDDTMDDFLHLCMKDSQINAELRTKRCFLNLALYQMLLRPDEITPFSNAFVVIQNSKNISVMDSAENKESNYWLMLKELAKLWGQTEWFNQQISKWIQAPLVPLKVTKGLELAIVNHNGSYRDEKLLSFFKQFYFRGDELISEGEDLPYTSILQSLSSSPFKDNIKNKLESFDQDNKFLTKEKYKYFCNFNLEPVLDGKVFTFFKPLKSRLFTVQYDDWLISLAAYNSVKKVQDNNRILAYFLLKPQEKELEEEQNVVNPQFCFLKKNDNETSNNILITSYEGRDPAQYIASTIQYIFSMNFELENLKRVMISPRYLLLLNPFRVGFEVDKSNDNQVENILKLPIPIFNQKNLGEMQFNGHIDNKPFYIPDKRGTQNYCSFKVKDGLK